MNFFLRLRWLLVLFFGAGISVCQAAITLPSIINNNMVLQQNTRAALWGWANPGEAVTISTSWNNNTITVTTDNHGKWLTYVPTTKAGGPYSIQLKGENQINLSNVMLGEVWLCSGQSNMHFPMAPIPNSNWATGVINYQQEVQWANYPNIRLFTVERKVSDIVLEDAKGNWEECSPLSVSDFSAVAYYFGKKIYDETGFPVGLINSSWGGTPAESWTKKEVLENDEDFKAILNRYDENVKNYPKALAEYKTDMEKWKADPSENKPAAPREPMGPTSNKSPYKLYNAMIAPLVPFTLKGVIWYQGESNADRAWQYRRLFPAMINNWRTDWNDTDLPFYFVQISPHRSQNPEIRDAQLYTYHTVPHTGIVVTTDNGDSLDIHPRNKRLVAERLARWALHNEYGRKSLVVSGPLYKSMKVEGNKIRIDFDFVDGGLMAKGPLTEFTIAGEDQQFVPANAVIKNGSYILVWNDKVPKPVAVRFAWRNIPHADLYNSEGLPASPFRTDNRKLATEGKN